MNNNKKEFILPPVGFLNLSRQRQNKINYSKLYNTCYIKASIQYLFHLEEFIYTILKSSGGKLLKATKNLVDNIRNAKENNNQKYLYQK